MKSITASLAVALGAAAAFNAPASPLDITCEGSVMTFNQSGRLAYDAATDLLSVQATPLLFFADSGFSLVGPSASGVRSVEIDVSVDASGLLIPNAPSAFRVVGALDTDGDGAVDLDGELLSGSVIGFGSENPPGTTDLFDFVFRPTGGALVSEYDGLNIAVTLASEQSTFAGFDTDFGGEAKGSICGTCLLESFPPEVVCFVEEVFDDPGCPCDIDRDGDLDNDDIEAFIAAYASGDADFNNDGVTDTLDASDFTDCFGSPPAECGLPVAGDTCVDANGDSVDVETVIMQYTGDDCDAPMNTQNPDKTDCSGDPMGAAEVFVFATNKSNPDDDKAHDYFSGAVLLGESFPISALAAGQSKLGSATFVYIYTDATRSHLLQSIEFHTSCSQPLFAGDTFGSLRVVSAIDEDGAPTGVLPGDDAGGVEARTFQINIDATDTCDSDVDTTAVIRTECGDFVVVDDEVIDLICFQPFAVTGEDVCEAGIDKPSELLLRYTGEDCSATLSAQDASKLYCAGDPAFDDVVFIRVSDKDDPNDGGARVFFEGLVELDDAFTVSSSTAGEDDFKSETHVHIYADASRTELIQQLEFHTSCSQPLRIGDQFGSISLLGVTGKNGEIAGGPGSVLECGAEIIGGRLTITASSVSLVVTATDDAGNTAVCETLLCEPDPIPEDCCDSGDKPDALVLRYTGEDCSATSTGQDSGKFGCSGDPAFDNEVFIISTNKEDADDSGARVYFRGLVDLDSEFTIRSISAGEDTFSSETFVHIYADSSRARLLQSVEFHTSCSQPLFAGDQYGSIQIVACEDPSPPQLLSCCENGDLNALLLTYTGESCMGTMTMQDPGKHACTGDPAMDDQVFIISTNKENPADTGARVYFSGLVNLEGQFVISALNAGEDKFGSETFVHIYADASRAQLLQSVEFHTSCSQPLFLGDQYGSIRIDGCEDPNAPVSCCDDGFKPNELDFVYTGSPCDAASNAQGSDKYDCVGDTMSAAEVLVLITNKSDPFDTGARVYFSGTTLLDGMLSASAANAGESQFSSASFIHTFDLDGTLLQSVEFHTSCSQPLRLGDTFGSYELVGCQEN